MENEIALIPYPYLLASGLFLTLNKNKTPNLTNLLRGGTGCNSCSLLSVWLSTSGPLSRLRALRGHCCFWEMLGPGLLLKLDTAIPLRRACHFPQDGVGLGCPVLKATANLPSFLGPLPLFSCFSHCPPRPLPPGTISCTPGVNSMAETGRKALFKQPQQA